MFVCPGCGRSVECTSVGHAHHTSSCTVNEIVEPNPTPTNNASSNNHHNLHSPLRNPTEDIDIDINNDNDIVRGRFAQGSVGQLPASSIYSTTRTEYSDEYDITDTFNQEGLQEDNERVDNENEEEDNNSNNTNGNRSSSAPNNPSAANNSSSGKASFLSFWFGPLVLASLAVLGLAFGIFNGEISLPHILPTLSSRTLAALTMMIQASDSVFKFLRN